MSTIQVGGNWNSIAEIFEKYKGDQTIQLVNVLDSKTGAKIAQFIRKDGQLLKVS
jgi:hypothetical protein